MKKVKFSTNDTLHIGQSGYWWHDGARGPLSDIPFIRQFGNVKISQINIDDNMGPHINDGIEIHFVKSGKHSWHVEGENHEKIMYPGDLSITAPWIVHGNPSGSMDMGHLCWMVIKPEEFGVGSDLCLGRWTNLPINFQKEFGKLIAEQNGIILTKVKHLEKYFDNLTYELVNQHDNYRLKIMNILELLFIDILRELQNNKDMLDMENNFIRLFTDLIMSDLSRKWEVEKLCKSFGMGKTMFTEKIKNLTGFPPQSFIINIRVTEAKKLLQKKKNDLTEIAYNCGFSSLQHLSSTFKQRTGITPKEYRNRYK